MIDPSQIQTPDPGTVIFKLKYPYAPFLGILASPSYSWIFPREAATRDIPVERIRVHVCWGAGEGPHNHDIELGNNVDVLLRARAAALSIVGANGRHEHEWQVWKDVKLPDGIVLVPGVIDSTTNIVEHPRTVAERIVRYAGVVGRENVVAGVDCGFGTTVGSGPPQVDPQVAWAKLQVLAEGAALATNQLWGR